MTAILFLCTSSPATPGKCLKACADWWQSSRLQNYSCAIIRISQKKDAYATLNPYRNCFNRVGKTWEERKSEQAILNQFDAGKNEYLLYVCVENYVRLRGSSPFPMQVFHAWFYALHLDLLGPVYPRQKFRDLFPKISQMDRYQQKRAALGVIKQSFDDPQVLANPQTEPMLVDH